MNDTIELNKTNTLNNTAPAAANPAANNNPTPADPILTHDNKFPYQQAPQIYQDATLRPQSKPRVNRAAVVAALRPGTNDYFNVMSQKEAMSYRNTAYNNNMLISQKKQAGGVIRIYRKS